MSGKNSIQVAIKLRPIQEKDQQSSWRVVNNSIQLIDSQTEPYYFDHIFDQDVTNQIIFDKMAKQIVHSAIQGFNGTIFAYGQTSSGKTYTMMGDEDNPGVMVLAAKEIFKEIERTQDRQFLLRVGYIEIYNEKIYDLLNKKNHDLKIHETSTGIVSVNCEECIIRSEDDLLNHLNKGSKERKVGETNMNERSSRSHAIFRIIIESRKIDRSDEDAIIQSVINLVDLAGSERADQTGATGARLKEGGHINKSLLFLSNVIKRLSENEDDKYISFRDSKLTRILQASLGGNALTAIICTIKPNAVEETQSTLNFALRAKIIKNKPQVNEIVSDATMMKRLEHEIKVLKSRLAEEQRKNESQIKVRQLEQRIKDEDLKIISCNSLHSIRIRENRRRTWCPSSTNLDTSTGNQTPSALPVSTINSHLPSNLPQASRLQAPKYSYYNTPLITLRPKPEPEPLSTTKCGALPQPADSMPNIDEEFVPGESINFEMLPPLQTPKDQQRFRNCSITPKLTGCPRATLEKVEHDLMELQSFTNLENKAEVQYDPDMALKQKVETLSQRNALLENERLEYLQLKDEFALTSNNLIESHKRFDELQNQLSKLTNSNKIANEKITQYEAELAELKKNNEKLEMENREAVNLEFEFKRHKNKSKLRETELLEALNEKEKEVAKLEKSLNIITSERLQNSKEELLQKSQSDVCQESEDGKVCIKCEDLQRLLEENKKVTLEFEKLTLEYEKLKLNYAEIEKESEKNKLQITQLQEIQEKERAASDKLLEDIEKLREKLENVQRDYAQLSSENSSKNEECMALTRQVEVAREEMMILEEKFTKLETSWQEQQQTLSDIEAQYANIQTKYEQLQCQYELLEVTRGQSLTDCQRLEKENVELQSEIEDLKKKVQDAQENLLKSNEIFEVKKKEYAMVNEERLSETSKIQQDNETLKKQLLDIQTQFDDLQKEYEDLSNQLMDSIQESEFLKNENVKVQEKLKEYEMKNKVIATAEDKTDNLRTQLENVYDLQDKQLLKTPSPCRKSSMRSSCVSIAEEDDEEFENYNEDMFKKFCALSESLTEIELEHTKGNKKVFKSISKNSTPNYKMHLKNILGVRKIQKEFDMEIGNIHLQGSFKHHSFHIVELSGEDKSCELKCDNVDINGCDNVAEYIEKLKQEIVDLRTFHEQECSKHKFMLASTERALTEMREQMQQLSAELLEKSIFVENCSCKTYQQQIETLEKEKQDITIVCGELQEKLSCTINNSFNNNLINDTTSCNETSTADKFTELENLKLRERELSEELDSRTKMLEELTQRYQDMETDLQTVREQLETQKKEYEEKCKQLQLDNLEKLEISSNEYRDNIKKYNKEWEAKKEDFELTIKELRHQIEKLKLSQLNVKDLKIVGESQLVNNRNDISDKANVETCINQTDITDDLKIIKQEKLELEEVKQSLEQQVYCLEAQLKDVQQENNKNIEEMSVLNTKISTLDGKLLDAVRKHSIVYNEKTSLAVQMEELKEELKCVPQLDKKNEELSDEVNRLNTEHKELLEKLHKTELQIDELCTEDSNREKLIEVLENKLSLLKTTEEEKKVLENELELLKKSCAQLQETLKTYHEKEQEYETIKKEVSALKEKCEKLDASQAVLLTEKCALEEKLQQQVADNVMLQTQLKVPSEEKTILLQNCSVLQQEEDTLKDELNCLQDKEKTEELLDQMINDNAEINRKIRIMTEKIQSLEKELAQKEDEIKAEREQNNDIQTNFKAIEELLNEKQQQLVEIEKEKEKIEKDSISINRELEELKQKFMKTNEDKEEQQKEFADLKQKFETVNDKLSDLLNEKSEIQLDYEKAIQAQNNLQNKLETLSKTLAEKQQEFNVLENNYHKVQSENKELQKKLQDMDAALTSTNVNEDKEEHQKEIADLKQKLETVNDKLSHLSNEKSEMQLDYEKAEQAKNNLENELKTLSKTLEEKHQEFKVLENNYHKVQNENKELQKKLQDMNAALTSTNVNEDKEEHQKEIADLKQKLETVNDKLSHLSNEKSEMQLDYNKAEQAKNNLENELKTLSKTLEEKHQEFKVLENNYHKVQNENEELQNKVQVLDAALTSTNVNEDKEEHQKEIADLKQKLETVNDKLSHLSNEKSEMQLDYKKAEQAKNNLENELKTLSKTLEEKHQEFKALENNYHKVQNENEELQNKVQGLDAALTNVNEDKKEHQKEIADLKQKLETVNDKLSHLSNEKSEMQLDYEKAEQAKNNLENELKTLSKTLEEKQQEFKVLENNYHKVQNENEELHKKVQDLDTVLTSANVNNEQQLKEIEALKQELQVAKYSLTLLTDEQRNLQKQLENYKSLKEEKSKLERTLNIKKSAQSGAITKLQQERDQLQATVKRYKEQQNEFKEKEDNLKGKVEALTQQLHEFRCKTQLYDNLLTEHEEVETALSKATAENQKLQDEVSQLTLQQEYYNSTMKNLSDEIEKLNLQMDKHLNEKRDLETKLLQIKETLQDEKSSLQHELQEMKSCLEELKLKCDSLRTANTQLQSLNQQLEQQAKEASVQLKEFNNLQDDFNRIKNQNTELQYNLKVTIEEAGRCSLVLQEDLKQHKQLVQKQQENLNSLKNEMETKCHSLEEEKLKLSSNIATLQREKLSLEDKLREITVRNFEQDLQRQAIDATANTLGDLNKSYSPKGRRSQDRLSGGGEIRSANISLEEKLISAIPLKNSTTAERRHRRLSTHDERRRQSYWGASHDKETMTDPVDNSCNCLELDRKLKECERNLFIKNSQVTALNMQLKNHPLKDENADLTKRLQEEQEKHRIEIKRYKNKLYEQTAKADKAIAAAAHATAKSAHAAATAAAVAEENSIPIIPVIAANVEVQTDDEISLSMHKLQAKYIDLKNICRYRFNVIKELEAKVAQKENSDGNSLSALEAAQYKILNNQCESLKRELKTVKDKYESAKKVLQSRREEIQKLRAQLDEVK